MISHNHRQQGFKLGQRNMFKVRQKQKQKKVRDISDTQTSKSVSPSFACWPCCAVVGFGGGGWTASDCRAAAVAGKDSGRGAASGGAAADGAVGGWAGATVGSPELEVEEACVSSPKENNGIMKAVQRKSPFLNVCFLYSPFTLHLSANGATV